LQRNGAAAAAPGSQPPTPNESGRTTGPSRPATPVSATPGTGERDGSGFPFDHFSGNIEWWTRDYRDRPSRNGNDSRSRASHWHSHRNRLLAALLLLRSCRAFRQSLSAHPKAKAA